MAWSLVIESATGRLVSQGTIVANPLPVGLEVRQLAAKPSDDEMWDEGTKGFVPRPVKVVRDRFQEFLSNAEISGLNAVTKARIQNALDAVFQDVRFD